MWRVSQTILPNHFNSLTLWTELREVNDPELSATREAEDALSLGEMSEEWLSTSSLQTECAAQPTHLQFTTLSNKI